MKTAATIARFFNTKKHQHAESNRGRRRRTIKKSRRFFLEPLEPRLLLSGDPFPIDPNSGEANLLELIENIPLNDIQTALDHFPIPYVVIAQKEGQAPVIVNNRAGAPTRVDVDNSLSTGRGDACSL